MMKACGLVLGKGRPCLTVEETVCGGEKGI